MKEFVIQFWTIFMKSGSSSTTTIIAANEEKAKLKFIKKARKWGMQYSILSCYEVAN